ncbi:NAD-binding protein [Nonomuraea sp. NPDC005501]|uniref:NAD-binding protein n=1 Tax=Nonomuraea sp. NPDC005501 TaxID=3156884 RepID=UPI0033A4285A
MTSSSSSRKRALVVGLGVSGIATAIGLRRIGWEPVIVERAPGRGDVERAAFAALPHDVEIRYATTPTHIEQDASGAEVTLEHDGGSVTERYDLVVGADGLRSTSGVSSSARTTDICTGSAT